MCLPLGLGVCLWVQGVSASGSGGVPVSGSTRGCLPLGPWGACLWVHEGVSVSGSGGCLPHPLVKSLPSRNFLRGRLFLESVLLLKM